MDPGAEDASAEERIRGGVDDEEEENVLEYPADVEAYFEQHGIPNVFVDDHVDEAGNEEGDACATAWPVERLSQPLYPGCPYTVQQYSYAMMKIKTGSIHDDRADQLCKLFAKVMPKDFDGPKYAVPDAPIEMPYTSSTGFAS